MDHHWTTSEVPPIFFFPMLCFDIYFSVFMETNFKIILSPTFRECCICPSVQFSSVAHSCLTLCDPMDCSTPGLPVHHQLQSLLKLMSIESVMPSNPHPLLSPSLPAFSLSQHQGLSQSVSSFHQVVKVLESFQ